MSSRASASRYARALFDVSLAKDDVSRTERELSDFVGLLGGHEGLQKALASPGVPLSGKRSVLEALVARAQCSTRVGKLLLLLADRDRLELLPDVLDVFRSRRMDHERVVQAEITTAETLEPAVVARLESRLSAATQRQVTMRTRVDPSLIGGMVTRIGSTVYDGSVATQLARIRERLIRQG
jgi:F-type H+-transporting ATPase subunit delta